ncbi:MAG: Predicted metal-dependent protease of the PAD1/JAB1 superfamily [uncultured Adhaeribacter sp.]|uniref:Predicted metal-dependent protease of the PAD1/JAB1 superfamily n=1 Tax=uncultured Adhaeribacter sp. TaxID=448109 RepID=A0A6J4I4R4_9BACT|nr:MAG: Predicted metal-dependent protease of the PAD1/JAB1 superfamily [uncultured Adhaeribacter sp.]
MNADKLPLQISATAHRIIQEHATEIYPDECCGFLYGQDNEVRLVQEAIPVINSKDGDKRRRFEISPVDYMRAERYALENNTSLLGVYHSHPDHPARPSEHDLKQAVPYFSYIIVSVMQDKVADITSWQLNEESQFEAENILQPENYTPHK